MPPRNEVRCGVVIAHVHLAIPTTNAHPAAFSSRAHERRPMIPRIVISLDHVVSDPASDQVVSIDAEHADSSRIGVDIRTIVVSDEHGVSSALEKCPVTSVLEVHNHPVQWPLPCDLSVFLVHERRSRDPYRSRRPGGTQFVSTEDVRMQASPKARIRHTSNDK